VKAKTRSTCSFEGKNHMKKVILINGLIAGVIVGGMLFISLPLIEKGYLNFDNGMVVGYASMIIALSSIYFGVKSYRDRKLNGTITFGKALVMGLLITLVAGVVYASAWDVYYRFYGDRFMASYAEHAVANLEKEGAAAGKIAAARAEMQAFGEMYENFFIRFGFTVMEILPVGLLISLATAAIVRKKSSGHPAVIV
jgi:hypothetical protein